MAKMTLICFGENDYYKEEITSLREVENWHDGHLRWLHINGVSEDLLVQLGNTFYIHPLVLKDLANLEQRPKFEDHDDYLFYILEANYYEHQEIISRGPDDQVEVSDLISFQAGFLHFDKLLITVLKSDDPSQLDPSSALKFERPKSGYKLDMLVYHLIDQLYNVEYKMINELGQRIDELEDQILANPDKKLLNQTYAIKRDLIYMRNSLWPSQLVLRNLASESAFVSEKTSFYLQDVYNQVAQYIDMVKVYHEVCSNMLETYQASINNKTNDIMKVLTVFSTIFIPLTFLAGVFGMNFKYFPVLEFRYAELAFWVTSIVLILVMLIYFKKKDWF